MDLNPFDDPTAVQHKVGVVRTAKLVMKRFGRHNVTVIAAGIAFYSLLALLPTLVAMTGLYSLVSDPQEILDQVDELAANFDQPDNTDTGDLIRSFGNAAVPKNDDGSVKDDGFSTAGLIGVLAAVLFALFSASGATQKLMNIVNAAYEAHESRPGLFLRGLAYLFTAAAILFVVALIGLLGVIPAAASSADLGGRAEAAVNVAIYPILAVLFILALTILYRYSPDRPRRTPWRNKGAVVATVLWVLSAIVFSFYARNVGNFGAAYALIGGIAGVIIFFQLTSISIIVGAEVNAVLEDPANAVDRAVGDRVAGPVSRPVDRMNAAAGEQMAVPVPTEPIGLGTALAGMAALFVLGRRR